MYRVLADGVAVVHIGYLAFLVAGGFVAWRWSRALWVHIAAAVWAGGIVTIGYACPLTALERTLRERAGTTSGEDGFIDRYVEGVLFPGSLTPWLRAGVAVAIAVSWWGWALRRRRAPEHRPAGPVNLSGRRRVR